MFDTYPFDHHTGQLVTATLCESMGLLLARDVIRGTLVHDERLPDLKMHARIGVLALVDSQLLPDYKEPTQAHNELMEGAARTHGFAQYPVTQWTSEQWRHFRRMQFSRLPANIKNTSKLLWHLSSTESRRDMITTFDVLKTRAG